MAGEICWGCGCHEVEGKLEVQCTQVPHQGELSAERHAVAQPYSAKCFRLASLSQAAAEPSGNPAAGNEAAPVPEPPLDREKLKALHLEEADRPE
jgi:hypothetical protein